MTVFVDWAFKATGAPASGARTMPDRLSDIINVKDWGATGEGGDYITAIQGAIDYAMDQGGGIVFFPQGSYTVSSPLIVGGAVDAPVILQGCGKEATTLGKTGGYTDSGGIGYTISSGTEVVDCLARMEGIGTTSGGLNIKATRDGFSIEECNFAPTATLSEPIGLNVVEARNVLVRSCTTSLSTSHGAPDDASPGDIRGCEPGTIAIALGSASSVVGTNVIGGYEIGYAISGEGCAVVGCRAETVGNGFRVGWGPDGEEPSYGCTIQGIQTERNMWHFVLYNATGCLITGCHTGQSEGLPVAESVTLEHDGATTVTVTTATLHNVAAGTHVIAIGSVASNWLPPGTATAGIVAVTRASTTTFTYTLAVDPGGSEAGTWNWPMEYNVRVRKAYECAIIGNNFTATAAFGIDLDYDGEAEHRNCIFAAARTTYGWVMPTDGANLGAWTFISVGALTAIPFAASTNAVHPYNTMVFADLPTGSGVQDGPYEGQEFDITDGSATALGNFAAVATGGGSNNVKVRYDGTNWRIVG